MTLYGQLYDFNFFNNKNLNNILCLIFNTIKFIILLYFYYFIYYFTF